jgi:crotonobetainyl-CoA:carnitine CoA-transferase CaiB-like acyl-CoA transferase
VEPLSHRGWALGLSELTRTLDLAELADDARFRGAGERYRNSAELVRILDARFVSKPLADWIDTLSKRRLIWAPVLTLAEAVEDPQAVAAGSFPVVDHPTEGPFRTVAPPLQMSGHALAGTAPAPALGADTEAVLREAGVAEDDLAVLVASSAS